jgi:hypothetical protein
MVVVVGLNQFIVGNETAKINPIVEAGSLHVAQHVLFFLLAARTAIRVSDHSQVGVDSGLDGASKAVNSVSKSLLLGEPSDEENAKRFAVGLGSRLKLPTVNFHAKVLNVRLFRWAAQVDELIAHVRTFEQESGSL